MGVFLLPQGIIKDIENTMNAYWWRGKEIREGKGIHWKTWKRLCAPKDWGGMGFRNLRSYNLAMLCKQSWRLMDKPDSLTAKVYKARYYPNSTFMDAKKGSNPSFVWSSLLETQDIIRRHSRWRVGRGNNIMIWTDNWLPDDNNPKVISFPFPLMENATVDTLKDHTDSGWDEEIIRSVFEHRDAELILKIPLANHQTNDKIIWAPEENGRFSVKSCYIALCGELRQQDKVQWAFFWKFNIPPKIKMFFWQICTDCIATKDLLRRRNVNCDEYCVLCDNGKESAMHLFTDCTYSKEIWRLAGIPTQIPHPQSFHSWINLNRVSLNNEQIELLILICWEIWKQRNEKVWNNCNPQSATTILNKTRIFLEEWRKATSLPQAITNRQAQDSSRWSKPQEGFLKLNVDAAIDMNRAKMGFGIVIRDCSGAFVAARGMQWNGNFTPREAEAVAVREALSWIKELHMDKVQIETDALKVVQSLPHNNGDSAFNLIINDIKNLLSSFSHVFLAFTKRSANRAVHTLARQSVSVSGCSEWFYNPPSFLCTVLSSDVN